MLISKYELIGFACLTTSDNGMCGTNFSSFPPPPQPSVSASSDTAPTTCAVEPCPAATAEQEVVSTQIQHI